MVFHYRLRVLRFETVSTRIPKEMKNAPNYIEIEIHNMRLVLRHAQIETRREFEYKLPISPSQVNIFTEEMVLKYYKMHYNETLIMVGQTWCNIGKQISEAVLQQGVFNITPFFFCFRNLRTYVVARMYCDLKLMVVEEIPRSLGLLNTNNMNSTRLANMGPFMNICSSTAIPHHCIIMENEKKEDKRKEDEKQEENKS